MKNKNIKMIVGAIAGVLLIAGVMFFVFKDNGSNQVVEAPVAEEQVIEDNTNQFAQDIIMRAQETAEAEPEEVKEEEKAEVVAKEEQTNEEQASIVASQDADSTEEGILGGAIKVSADASPAEIVDAVKENVTKKQEAVENTDNTQQPATQTTPQPAVYRTPDGRTFNSPEELAAALGGSVGFDDLNHDTASQEITDTQFGINLQ